MTGRDQFISLPQDRDDPRQAPELLNLDNVALIQIFEEDKLLVHFANGNTRNYYGDRAKTLIRKIVN